MLIRDIKGSHAFPILPWFDTMEVMMEKGCGIVFDNCTAILTKSILSVFAVII